MTYIGPDQVVKIFEQNPKFLEFLQGVQDAPTKQQPSNIQVINSPDNINLCVLIFALLIRAFSL